MSVLDKIWYTKHPIAQVLLPLSWLFCLAVLIRRKYYDSGLAHKTRLDVPVIVIGNITVGGTGKTPLVVWLVKFLKRAGYKPGIISRGYGGKATSWPQQVRPDSDPVVVGDEPILLSRHCQCPVAVGPDRIAAARALQQYHDINIIVSDDGLQHYSMERDIEIAVIDGVRRFGNGYCLPAGPLRELPGRLREVDVVVTNGLAQKREFSMRLVFDSVHKLDDDSTIHHMEEFKGKQVHAVAGIGYPERFFRDLRNAGLIPIEHAYPDHHAFSSSDISFDDGLPVIMTEKDAVKCRRFASGNQWYVKVSAQPDERISDRLVGLLKKL